MDEDNMPVIPSRSETVDAADGRLDDDSDPEHVFVVAAGSR